MIRYFGAAGDQTRKCSPVPFENKKMGEASGLSHFALEVRLEIDAQPELNPARTGIAVRGNQLGVDHTKVRKVGDAKGRVQKRRVVKGVEEVKRKLQLRAFVDGGNFPEPQV
jgi:hypothetical protein